MAQGKKITVERIVNMRRQIEVAFAHVNALQSPQLRVDGGCRRLPNHRRRCRKINDRNQDIAI